MGNRGTKKTDPPKKSNIAGKDFKKDQDEKLEESGIEYISSGRGTSKIKADKTKNLKKKPEYKGKIHTGRGTGSQ